MKQNITRDQLKELSREGHESLNNWWRIREGDRFIVWDFPDHINIYTKSEWEGRMVTGTISPLLSIGQMVEFLEDEWESNIG